MRERAPRVKCLSEGCDRPAKSRGLCDSCYQSALSEVNKQRTTWIELIKLGLAKKARVVAPVGGSAFNKALKAAREAIKTEQEVPKTVEIRGVSVVYEPDTGDRPGDVTIASLEDQRAFADSLKSAPDGPPVSDLVLRPGDCEYVTNGESKTITVTDEHQDVSDLVRRTSRPADLPGQTLAPWMR